MLNDVSALQAVRFEVLSRRRFSWKGIVPVTKVVLRVCVWEAVRYLLSLSGIRVNSAFNQVLFLRMSLTISPVTRSEYNVPGKLLLSDIPWACSAHCVWCMIMAASSLARLDRIRTLSSVV